jgi:hypothetical protein
MDRRRFLATSSGAALGIALLKQAAAGARTAPEARTQPPPGRRTGRWSPSTDAVSLSA